MVRRHELSDAEWAVVRPHLPAAKRTGRPRLDDRLMVNGILWILGTGAPWRDLPERYGRWQSVYARYRLWSRSGAYDHLLEALQRDLDQSGALDWKLFLVDGTSVRAHRSAAGARGENRGSA